MVSFVRASCFWLVVLAVLLVGEHSGLAQEARFALVIGNDQYPAAALATPANDAGLVADALGAAGFTVTGARNLDQAALRETFREFIGQVAAAGPNAVAVVYLAGFGLQFAGENYFIPVDADIQRDVDVPLQAVRVSDFTQSLAALPGRVKIVILDAARQNSFAHAGRPLAGGLALLDPQPSLAFAFNAAPGTVGPDEQGPYGAFATALTEMISEGGLSLDDMFARIRLRVSTQTQGVEVPWYVSQIDGPFFMTERTADAPPPPNALAIVAIRNRPFRDYASPDEAYAAAIALDTIDAYEDFLGVYPDSPYAHRIAAMLAVRREEIIWRRCVMADTPPAYWSYLRRYPDGPHAWDARRRLTLLAAALEPPPDLVLFDFGIAPPPPAEFVFVDRPVIIFEGPGFLPPPPPPLVFLPPRPREFVVLAPPPPARERFALPIPAAPVPTFVRPPRTVTMVQPLAPNGPGERTTVRVSLPAAVAHGGEGVVTTPGVKTPSTNLAPLNPAHPNGPGGSPPPNPPSTAAIKPATLPPHPAGQGEPRGPNGAPQTAPTGASIKPPPPPPHPGAPNNGPNGGSASAPSNAAVKPAFPPQHAAPPSAAAVKPPAPPPPPPHPAAISVKPATPPAPPPPHPTPADGKAAGHPAGGCPPGKTATPTGCK
jgi:uncharacterized caspase-like protein